jgi:carboxyl-terminal processing protease
VRPLAEQLAAQGAPKLLVDLRSIAGGPGRTGYQVAKLFAAGDLGTLAERSRTEESFHGDAAPVWKGEIVVLVDGGTQGPAEVLAAALRQRAGARLVGVRTFGYAGERHFVDLDDGARLLLTRAFYTAPDGTALSKGLAPDLLVDDLQRSFGERDKPLSDLILERGIELLEGQGPAVKAAA